MELKKYKLGDLCTFINGRAYLQPELQNSGKYKIVRVGNLSGGNNSWYYSDMELEPTKYCAKGDLLYAWACNFGPYIWKGDKTIYHYHIWKVINSELIDKIYLYYLLKFMTNSFMGCVHGSTMLHITKENMESMEVRIHASIEEQRRIATILNKLDCKIELNRQINDNLEAMAKQLYDYWFVQFDFPNEEGKPYKSSGGAMVWNEKLKREIPQRWNLLPIADVLDKYPTTKRYETKEYLQTGTYPIIDQGDAYIVGFTNENDNLLTRHPAVLFGDHSTKVKFLDFDFARGADGTQILYSSNDAVSQYYLYLVVNSLQIPNPGYSRHFKYLKELPIVIPSLSIATEFMNIVKPLFEKWTKNIFNNIALTKQRDELLPLLMNGQASVNSD